MENLDVNAKYEVIGKDYIITGLQELHKQVRNRP
jgi:hypothetical protein